MVFDCGMVNLPAVRVSGADPQSQATVIGSSIPVSKIEQYRNDAIEDMNGMGATIT